SPAEQWDGYLVIQAKFLQRPRNDEKDANWVLAQFRKELDKFASSRRNLRLPEYYILATNVTLTPVHEKGSKDRATALVESYRKELPLKAFFIWDYDQIRIYLDRFTGIRTTYAAWIFSADVLHALAEEVRETEPQFLSIVSNLLQKELLADQFIKLEQAGHVSDSRTSMARVFIDVPAIQRVETPPPSHRAEETSVQSKFD